MRLWTFYECYIAGTNSLKEELLVKAELSIYIVDKKYLQWPNELIAIWTWKAHPNLKDCELTKSINFRIIYLFLYYYLLMGSELWTGQTYWQRRDSFLGANKLSQSIW